LALLLAGCASANHAQIAIDPMVQADAPVQVVSITPDGDNLLAKVTVKNATDRPSMISISRGGFPARELRCK